MPRDATSLAELEQIVSRLARRDNRWQVYQRIAEAAEVPLAADEIWLLVQICIAPAALSPARLSQDFSEPVERLEQISARLLAKALATRRDNGALAPSNRGWEMFQRMVTSRRARLSELLERWAPEQHAEVKAMLDGLARALIAELPVAPEKPIPARSARNASDA
jgi:hypothetical protein